jgi:hypothetical protein
MYYNFSSLYREHSERDIDGWSLYDPVSEYKRQGIDLNDETCLFKLTEINRNFSACATYPEYIIVPKAISDEDLKEASNFRTKSRFPALSYVHNANLENHNLINGNESINNQQGNNKFKNLFGKERDNNLNSNKMNGSKSENKLKFRYGGSIWRSSQTRSGLTQNRSYADEKLLRIMGELSENKLVIFDARPYLNALANRVY